MALRTLSTNPLNGPLRYWEVMRTLTRGRGCFTVSDVHGLSAGRTKSTVKQYVAFCLKAGAIELVGTRPTPGAQPAHTYRVTDLRASAPVHRRESYAGDRGRRLQHLWNAIRALRQFTTRELAVAASTDQVTVTEHLARTYVRSLAKAGYLAEVGARERRGLPATWRLRPAYSTGPKAPSVSPKAGVYDVNLQRVVNLNNPIERRAA